MTQLGRLALDQRPRQRQRVRRKLFETLRVLGVERDLAARIAAEVSDTCRALTASGASGVVDIALASAGDAPTLVLTFDLRAGEDEVPSETRPQALLHATPGAVGQPRVLRYALRVGAVDTAAQAQAQTLLASRSREELFAQLEASNSALQRSSAEAQRASDAKARFLANMSHEIRTPMNAIIGLNRMLLKSEVTPQQRDYLEKIERSARHLLGIIDDVLDVSKLEAGKVELERGTVVLADVLDDVATLLAEQCRAKGLRFELEVADDVPAQVVGDALRLRQVLLNLVTNAVKFTERGGVTVALSRLDDPDRRVRADASAPPAVALRFDVRDSGIGISHEDQRALFTSFSQADATITRRYGGSGLGLAISKGLVELMGGAIGVESVPGEGSTFWFSARFEAAASAAPKGADEQAVVPAAEPATSGGPVAPEPIAASARLLVVEDNALNREIVASLLDELGLRAHYASNGLEALEALRRRPFDLVLMDVQMPVMDGITATRRICADPALRHVPVIGLTASALRGDQQVCLEAGMREIVVKPIDPARLEAALRRWLPHGARAASDPEHDPGSAPDDATGDPLARLRGSETLDVERGLRFTRGNPALYLRLLRGFLDEERELPTRLRASLAEGDLREAERLAHTVRGLASGLGARPLATAAEALERALRGGDAAAAATAEATLASAHAALLTLVDASEG